MKKSVIIPVYNTEQYLGVCIQSVLDQTYRNLEIILINDGSVDQSPQMCDEYAKHDSRITVIHKTNEGPSIARNIGIQKATGDYILFLDSDDYWIDSGLVEMLYKKVKNNSLLDLIYFGRTDYYENTDVFIEGRKYDETKIQGKQKNEVLLYLIQNKLFSISSWLFLIKKQPLIDNQIYFEPSLIAEDIDWCLHIWLYVNFVDSISSNAYCYRHQGRSRSINYTIKNVQDFVYILGKWEKIIKKTITDSTLKNLYLNLLCYLYPTLLRNYFLINKKDRKLEYQLLKSIRSLISYGITSKSRQVKIVHFFTGFRLTCIIFGSYGLIKKRGWAGLKQLI